MATKYVYSKGVRYKVDGKKRTVDTTEAHPNKKPTGGGVTYVYDKGVRYRVNGKKRTVDPTKKHPAKKPGDKTKPATTKKPAKPKTPEQLVNDALGNIDKPITGTAMQQTAQTLVNSEYAPILAGLTAQEAKIAAQRDQQQKWALGYQGGINSLFGSTQAAQAKANADHAAVVDAAKAQHIADITKAHADSSAAMADDAKTRGTGLDGGSAAILAKSAQSAQANAAAQGAAQQAFAASTGGAQEAFLRGLAGAASMRGGETQAAIGTTASNALADVAAQRKKLDDDKLGKFTDTLLKLRQQEREGWLTQQGIASGVEKARLDAKVSLADIKSKAQLNQQKLLFEASLKQQGWDRADAKAAADREFTAAQKALDRGVTTGSASYQGKGDKGTKKKSKYTPVQQQAVVTKVKNAASKAKMLIGAGGLSSTEIRQALETKYKFDHEVVNAAMDLASPSKGYLSAPNIKYLQRYGIVVHDYFPIKKPKTSKFW